MNVDSIILMCAVGAFVGCVACVVASIVSIIKEKIEKVRLKEYDSPAKENEKNSEK